MRPPSEKKVDCGGDKTHKKQIDFDKVEKVFVVSSSLFHKGWRRNNFR
jgi:hypothetical protein